MVLAIGLPGSGKSSWFKRHNITPLSSDMLRALLFDDPTEQRFQDLIFSNLRSMLKARLIARRPLNYVDATNLTPHERQSWIKLGHDYGYEVQAVFFDVPLEVCLERNHKRERTVADDVMRRMSAKLKPPTFEEGFSKITVVQSEAEVRVVFPSFIDSRRQPRITWGQPPRLSGRAKLDPVFLRAKSEFFRKSQTKAELRSAGQPGAAVPTWFVAKTSVRW